MQVIKKKFPYQGQKWNKFSYMILTVSNEKTSQLLRGRKAFLKFSI